VNFSEGENSGIRRSEDHPTLRCAKDGAPEKSSLKAWATRRFPGKISPSIFGLRGQILWGKAA
jgi:hypothetical protein